MASIRQTDTLHNKRFSKGRPAKPDRERNKKRQETYRWRDARRIYLANSFDRWRKLRCSLDMKDSVLAWHLMEAHEKGPCGVCSRNLNGDHKETDQDDQHFLPQLIEAVRKVCYSNLQFEKCIRIVGLLCLEFDNSRKENINIDETISSEADCLKRDNSLISQTNNCPSSSNSIIIANAHSKSSYSLNVANVDCKLEFKKNDSGEREVCLHKPNSVSQQPNSDHQQVGENEQSSHYDEASKSISEMNKCNDSGNLMESEMEVSLEIDVEKIDTSQEQEDFCGQSSNNPVEQNIDAGHDCAMKNTSLTFPAETRMSNGTIPQGSISSAFCQKREIVVGQSHPSPIHGTSELPLDMSVEKIESLQKGDLQGIESPTHHMDTSVNELSVDTSYSDHKGLEMDLSIPKGKDVPPLQSFHSSRMKEEVYPSIPWQRRDMSRKEEYEFLELNPFCDLAEFSHRYPHVHQRTYYRWKRRIKEEYIILEQCPKMSFDEFSSVVLQAKPSVFNLWKSLIAQGKGFFAPSDASKRLEAKCPLSKSVNTLSEQYVFLQKNIFCTQEQFCQKFLETSPEVFNTLKKKVMQEFWVFCHNSNLNWRDFSKLVDVSEEVYNIWRDHVTRDMKSVVGGIPPNAQMMPTHCPPFQNTSHSQSQLLNANIPTVDSAQPEDSRNLSANYLNSVQNMIFPWASYYGVPNPLNQQLLPMVLWPRIMGLNGAKSSNLMGLPMTSPSSCGSQPESPHQETSLPTHLQPHTGLDPNTSVEEKSKVFGLSQCSENNEYIPERVNRISSYVPNESDSYEYGFIKKQRVNEELENLSSHSPVSKSRKQNKQEYVYYLKNPSLSFKDLETLFPSISLRTFYRWRKEMNAALLYMRENADPIYQQFKLVFPDIPEDVFEVWKTKSGKENFAERILFTQNVQTQEVNEPVSGNLEMDSESSYSHKIGAPCIASQYTDQNKEMSILGEASPSKKQFKTGHLFIHKNPNVDFTAFSKLFPNISARSFYRWKKEWKDAIELLQSNPDLDYERYKSIDSSVSEEIFDAWKQFSSGVVNSLKMESFGSGHDPLFGSNNNKYSVVNNYLTRKENCQEFAYLQLNSQVDFDKFNTIYPHISKSTFDQWKQEIHQIIKYIESQPSVSFEEISAVLPDVTEEAFLKWKEQRTLESKSNEESISTDESDSEMKKHNFAAHYTSNNDETKMQITNALLHLMHQPNIEYQDFHQLFPIISAETFEQWLQRIKYFIQQISSNPNLEFEEFRSVCNEVEEDVFRKWKSLTPEEICAIGNQTVGPSPSDEGTNNFSSSGHRERALKFCQENPFVNYTLFSEQYCSISETDFKCWMLKLSTQMSFIRDNPNMSFKDFSGIYPDVEKAVFDLWRKMSSTNAVSPFKTELSSDDAVLGEKSNAIYNNIRHLESDRTFSNSKLLIPEDHKPASQVYLLDDKVKTEDQESSLEKLAKLADGNTPYCYGLNSRVSTDVPGCKDETYLNPASTNLSPSLSRECSGNDHNNISDKKVFGNDYEHQFHYTSGAVDQDLLRSDVLPPSKNSEPLYVESKDVVPPKIQENQLLSNLMVMSADHHKFSPAVPKLENNVERVSQAYPNADKWNYPNSQAANMKEDEEMFSSQRQKKMSRAEYLYVKDNPDVDSQEFARIFPRVSARTFYRWKKEIKAQKLQVA